MLVVRVVGLLVAIALAACLLLWLGSGQRKWLVLAWRLLKAALFLVVLILVLLFGERLLLV